MNLIVAADENWAIGNKNELLVRIPADQKFFRETTKGCMVLVGRKTVEDFPGKKPLPGRENVLLTRNGGEYSGFTVCKTVEEVLEKAKNVPRAMVIGGGSVYRLLLPYCDTAYVTKVHAAVSCDTCFPNLDADPRWKLEKILLSGEEEGIPYEMCVYKRI